MRPIHLLLFVTLSSATAAASPNANVGKVNAPVAQIPTATDVNLAPANPDHKRNDRGDGSPPSSQKATPQPLSYLALPVDSLGMLPSVPYVWQRSAGMKQLVVIGTIHTRDPKAPMYDEIERIFDRVQPDLVLHESSGPQRPETLRDLAIQSGGGIGHAYYLASRHSAVIRSGDAPEQEEFAELLKRYPAKEVLVYLTGQRFIGGYDPDSVVLEKEYPEFFSEYLHANGIPLEAGWDTWAGFLKTYEQVMGRPFTASTWDPDWVSPIRDAGLLSEIARSASQIRDQRLLDAIGKGLQEHDSVIVVFGGWHVLALEPLLEGVFMQAIHGPGME